MNLYWLVELNGEGARRALAVVGEADGRRACRALGPAGRRCGEAAGLPVDVDVVVEWARRRVGLVPVASPPLTDNLVEAVDRLALRVAAAMRGAR